MELRILLSSRFLSKNFKIKIYKTIILLPFGLYSCEAWSLTLRQERRLRVFDNRILRRIFGLKREMNGGGGGSTRRNYGLYRLSNTIRVIKSRTLRWADHVARMKKVGVF